MKRLFLFAILLSLTSPSWAIECDISYPSVNAKKRVKLGDECNHDKVFKFDYTKCVLAHDQNGDFNVSVIFYENGAISINKGDKDGGGGAYGFQFVDYLGNLNGKFLDVTCAPQLAP